MKSKPTQPEEVVLREFRLPGDYAEVIELWEHAGPGIHVRRSDQIEELSKKLTRDPDLFLIAEAGGKIIGTVMGGFDGRRGMVYHLAVEETLRNKGIGAKLMEELERRLKAKGCIRSYLMVTTDNQDAIHFYQKRGWEEMDIHVLAKDLD
jgi:ribosomal protein S18 acetylase RimI-like enzyme